MSKTCIVVGASHAATQFVISLRQSGWEGRIQVIGEEPFLPYHRPPLSKEFLVGIKKLEEIYLRPPAVYEKAAVEFVLNTRAESIEPDAKKITLNTGEVLSFDKLALTVGSRVRKVDLAGVNLKGIHYLRNVLDVEAITPFIRPDKKAVIVGGGYIGLETAAVLNKRGMDVTVLEMMDRVLPRVTAPEVSAFYARIHGEEGVHIHCNTAVEGFEGDDVVQRVRCRGGNSYAADLVIIGIGIIPNIELARDAGLESDNGIVVDRYARTNHPDIVAAGDCTWHHNTIYDRWLRLESVQNANDQARVAAAAVCGKEIVYDALPWFWSDQYDLKLQIAGLSQGYDELIIRGDRENSRSFAAFYLREGAVIAVDAVNRPPEFMMGKRLITERVKIDKARLADDGVHIRELLK